MILHQISCKVLVVCYEGDTGRAVITRGLQDVLRLRDSK